MENASTEKMSYVRFIVLGIIIVILAVVIILCVTKIGKGDKNPEDTEIISVLELAFDEEIKLYGKKVKEVQTHYKREGGGKPFTVISEYNEDGKITKMIVQADDGEYNQTVDVEYETDVNRRIITWICEDEIIKEMVYLGLFKEKETYYGENGQITQAYEYEKDRTFNGKDADYVYDITHHIEYMYVHERYESDELNKTQKLDSIYQRKSVTSNWEYIGDEIHDQQGHLLERSINYGELYEAYTYEYDYDKNGSETGYKKFKGKELISETEIEYFNN